MVPAAVLAGGGDDPAFSRAYGVGGKWRVDIGGAPMIRWVLDALNSARAVSRTQVCGPAAQLRAAGVSEPVLACDGGNLSATLRAALEGANEHKVLVIAADVPLITGEALDSWVAACLGTDADVCFPVVSWESMQARIPGARKTWYDLRDGRFTKGNMVLATPSALLRRLSRIDRLYETRKRKQWARLMPGRFLTRMALGRLTLSEASRALSAFTGCMVAAVPADPELAVDVDEVGDVAFVRSVLLSGSPCAAAVA